MADTFSLVLDLLDGARHSHLCRESGTLGRGISASHNSIVSVKVLGDFLEWRLSGLDVEEPNDRKLNSQPAAVEDVVFPADVLEGNWVNVLIEEEGQVDAEEHDGETLGSDIVRENFGRVSEKETGPGAVVSEIVQEDHGDDSVGGALCAVDDVSG